MNFFESQEKARKKTFSLIVYFFLAITMIILTIDASIVALLLYMHSQEPFLVINGSSVMDRNAIFSLSITVASLISPFIIFVIGLGTLIKYIRLGNGGISLAKMLNAKPVDLNTNDPLERRMINVIEEMSIASGVSIPHLFILENEKSINAFVAGIKPADTIMVVTRGALEQLTRDELQGVIGHEFSHIFNSDMRISLRLMAILGGLLIIGQIGYFVMRIVGNRRTTRSSSKKSDPTAIIFLIGLILFVVGYIGLFFGRLIKASVCRQRESLADACSVQYTRNPIGLIGALKRIQASETGSKLETKNAEDISHLCFSPPFQIWFSNLLATHPPIEKRIAALDPQGQFKDLDLSQETQEIKKFQEKNKKNQSGFQTIAMATILANETQSLEVNANELEQSIGNPTQAHIDLAKEMLSGIDEFLLNIIHSPENVALIFYALLLPHSEKSQSEAQGILLNQLNQTQLKQVFEAHDRLKNLGRSMWLTTVDLAMPAFKANPAQKREEIYALAQKVAELDREKLYEFALLAIISKAVQDHTPKMDKTKYNSIKPVLSQTRLLIAFLIASGHPKENEKDILFKNIMGKHFLDVNPPLPAIDSITPEKLRNILSDLRLVSPPCKEAIIKACLACVQYDGVIKIPEAELIRAIASCLDCPIPPILPSSTTN